MGNVVARHSVHGISEERSTDGRKVHAYLVRSAGLYVHLDE